jgi:enoyl-CoA hydratase/carnithine racemase
MSTYHHWLLQSDNHVATLTLNRAAQRNSLTPETFHELRDLTAQLRADRDVWGVVVQSAGEHFSVGVDVNVIGSSIGQDKEAYGANLRDLQNCLDEFEALEKPTIAKLQGYCLGGGLLLALCCDFRIASERTTFGFPEVKRGLAVVMGTQRVTRFAGAAATKELILLAEFFNAQMALRHNLVHQVAPPDQLDATVNALADKFRKLPPLTVGVAKRIIDRGASLSLRESQELEIASQAELLNSADFQEAIRSFFEKRAPQFRGA